jgi:hypothetical protein
MGARRRHERDKRGREAEPERAACGKESEQAKGEPVQGGRQQEHARRARRDRIDEPPEHRHGRRLPIAKMPGHGVGIDIAGIGRAVAGVEDQHGQAIAARHREERKP